MDFVIYSTRDSNQFSFSYYNYFSIYEKVYIIILILLCRELFKLRRQLSPLHIDSCMNFPSFSSELS